MPSVLAHLAHRLAAHPEDIATEALVFILNRSQSARNGFTRFIGDLGFDCKDVTKFHTQVSDGEGARPDIVGSNSDGLSQVTIEAKFWAGLTDNQPVGYLASLSETQSLLLFVAPAKRLETLWEELLKRCSNSGISTHSILSSSSHSRVANLGTHLLGLTSWRALLLMLLSSVESAGDTDTISDIRQLIELCESMDSEAFLPLTSEELTSTLGRRVIQFGDLAHDLTNLLVSKGYASTKRLRATGGNGSFGRYLLLKGHGSFLHFNARWWAKHGHSPLWLQIIGPQWIPSDEVRVALTQGTIKFFDSDNGFWIPVVLQTGVERDQVLHVALSQILAITNLLPSVESEASTPPSDVLVSTDSEEDPEQASL